MRYRQIRVAPKNLLQPALDGVKLLLKENIYKGDLYIYIGAPVLVFCIIARLNFFYNFTYTKFIFFFLIALFGVNVYRSILRGWSSFSKYALVGAIRSSSQSVSYEIVLRLLIIRLYLISPQGITIILSVVLFIILLIETNRAPFDFREGERELIRGFNIEYRSVLFVFLFLGEYGIIIFCAWVSAITRWVLFVIYLTVYLGSRSSYPRYRYDILIGSMWKDILPIVCIIITAVYIYILK